MILGTRGSKLALAQAGSCAEGLRAAGFEVEVRIIKTTSEHHPDLPLSVIDQRDVFTRQLDEALLAGEIDLAVHSLKDVPTGLPRNVVLAAVTRRHDPRDALVSDQGYDVDGLPEEAVVATSSVRRKAHLLHRRPDLRIVEIRGNVDTRVRKMRGGAADALVLAGAGLQRLGLDVPRKLVSPLVLMPAVGQGALAVAMLEDHPLRGRVRAALNHGPSERAALAERAMLGALEGGCRVPVGALASGEGPKVLLRGAVSRPDGAVLYRGQAEGTDPREVGERLALDFLDQVAAEVWSEIQGARGR